MAHAAHAVDQLPLLAAALVRDEVGGEDVLQLAYRQVLYVGLVLFAWLPATGLKPRHTQPERQPPFEFEFERLQDTGTHLYSARMSLVKMPETCVKDQH